MFSLEYLQKFCAKGADGSEYICNMQRNHWAFSLFFVHLRSMKPMSHFSFLFPPLLKMKNLQWNQWAFFLFFFLPYLRWKTCRQMEYAATVERIREEAWVKHKENQGGRSWQPFGESKNGHKTFVKRAFAIFATNSSLLLVIAKL